jgi:hypothetical protein
MVVGIMGAALMLVLIFSLACQAQKSDAYLEQLGRGEGDCLEDR